MRGSLYITEMLSGLDWSTRTGPDHVPLTYEGADVLTLNRPSQDVLTQQCQHVRDYADLRDERGAEIVSQLGFPTEYFAMILGLHPAQHKKTFELITATQVVAAHIAMIVKHALAVRRPDQIDGRILPMIPTPGHCSFPSAHATEAFAVLTVITELVTQWGSLHDADRRIKMLRGLAERIAVNRTVAGVHFPIDSWAGAALGTTIGHVILGRCGIAAPCPSRNYTAQHSDFFDYDFSDSARAASQGMTEGAAFVATSKPAFTWLWTAAAAEKQAV